MYDIEGMRFIEKVLNVRTRRKRQRNGDFVEEIKEFLVKWSDRPYG